MATRVDDAMHAIRAAVEEGILPGGGVALLRAAEALKRVRTQNDDQKTGVDIVRKALSWPARQIAINAGEDGSIIVGKILEKDQYAFGFDAQNGEYVNLVTKGIIDPTKVVAEKPSPWRECRDSVFCHESAEAGMRGSICRSGRAVFVHRTGGACTGEPSAEKDPGTCARCAG